MNKDYSYPVPYSECGTIVQLTGRYASRAKSTICEKCDLYSPENNYGTPPKSRFPSMNYSAEDFYKDNEQLWDRIAKEHNDKVRKLAEELFPLPAPVVEAQARRQRNQGIRSMVIGLTFVAVCINFELWPLVLGAAFVTKVVNADTDKAIAKARKEVEGEDA